MQLSAAELGMALWLSAIVAIRAPRSMAGVVVVGLVGILMSLDDLFQGTRDLALTQFSVRAADQLSSPTASINVVLRDLLEGSAVPQVVDVSR